MSRIERGITVERQAKRIPQNGQKPQFSEEPSKSTQLTDHFAQQLHAEQNGNEQDKPAPTLLWQNLQGERNGRQADAVPEGYIIREELLQILQLGSTRWNRIRHSYPISIIRIGQRMFYKLEDVNTIQEQREQERLEREARAKKSVVSQIDGRRKNGRKPSAIKISDLEAWGIHDSAEPEEDLDLFRLHLQEIGQIPLLSAEEEKNLASKIFNGQLALKSLTTIAESGLATLDQREKIKKMLSVGGAKFLLTHFNLELAKRLNREEDNQEFLNDVKSHENWLRGELEFARKIEIEEILKRQLGKLVDQQAEIAIGGIEAYKSFADANLRLVVKWAKKYQGLGFPLEDLIGYGHEGLMRASAKFDFHKGYKFSTYSSWWIRQAISRGIHDYASTIRVPVHTQVELGQLRKEMGRRVQELGRSPTYKEMVDELREDQSLVSAIRVKDVASLNQLIGDETEMGDFLPDENGDVEELGERSALQEAVWEVIKLLDSREQKVIILRFGLDNGGGGRSLEEVGQIFGITRERVRQIEAKALQKLRHPSRSSELAEFAEALG